MDGDAALTGFIARVRALGRFPADAAKLAAPLVEEASKRTATAGTTPDGKPWQPTKEGGRALVHAADAIAAKAIGTAVVITLTGVEAIHNFGTKRVPKRTIIPEAGVGLPANLVDALTSGASRAFARAMEAG